MKMNEDNGGPMKYLIIISALIMILVLGYEALGSNFKYEIVKVRDGISTDDGRKRLIQLVYLSHKIGCLSLFKYMVDEKIMTEDLQKTNETVQRFCEKASKEAAEEVTR